MCSAEQKLPHLIHFLLTTMKIGKASASSSDAATTTEPPKKLIIFFATYVHYLSFFMYKNY